MKIRNLLLHSSKKIAMAAVCAVAVAGANATVVQGQTTLTGLTSTNNPVPANHGSNAAGTPNISLTWDADWDQYNGWSNDPGGGVYQHDNALNDPHTIDFTPDVDWNVVLTSLDLNYHSGAPADDTDVFWSVDGTVSGNLGSGTNNVARGIVETEPFGFTGVDGETLTLSLTQTSGSNSWFAVDNLTFDQVSSVPEPSSIMIWSLIGAGLMGYGWRRLRRR